MDAIYLKNPMNRTWYNTLLGKDDPYFKGGIQLFLDYYNKILIKKGDNMYLPKGSLIYHGSLVYPFYAESNIIKGITFFGLDMDISMWYIYELIKQQRYLSFQKLIDRDDKPRFKRYGYLYVFKLTQDLPITEIIEKIYKNPKGKLHCRRKNHVCLHPQVSYRGSDFNYNTGSRIHTELTLNYNKYKDSLKLIRTYIVDAVRLHDNHTNMNYNVRNAILKEYANMDYIKNINYKDYTDKFLTNPEQAEKFYCEYGCGFTGNYEEVLKHETICPKRKNKSKKKNKSKNKY